MTRRGRIGILNDVLNMDEEIKKLPSCLIDKMNETFLRIMDNKKIYMKG
jgi:hypothetical protein